VSATAPAVREGEVAPPYEFNLLVSGATRGLAAARGEILKLLRFLGDEQPLVARTAARGIVGVKTALDPRLVVQELRALLAHHPRLLQHTAKWVPIDLWTSSDIESLRRAVGRLKDRIAAGETWRMTVERRGHGIHTRELIALLAPLLAARVDLRHPQRILRVDMVGPFAALSVLGPADILSVARARR
jgi:tRNA(Ser,Leu) C12 N-acetylase TAN1